MDLFKIAFYIPKNLYDILGLISWSSNIQAQNSSYHIASQRLIASQPILLGVLGDNSKKGYKMFWGNDILWFYQIGKITNSQAERGREVII